MKKYSFEIHQNLGVQSSHDKELFTNPDIIVIKSNTCEYTRMYYDTKTVFSFVKNENLISFFIKDLMGDSYLLLFVT